MKKQLEQVHQEYREREDKMLARFCLILNEKKDIIRQMKEGAQVAIPKAKILNQDMIQSQIDTLKKQT